MRVFACLLDLEGHGIGEASKLPYENFARGRGLHFQWHSFDRAAVLIAWNDPLLAPMVVSLGQRIAVGDARLDNRPELDGLAGPECTGLTDLAMLLHLVTRLGTPCVRRVLGDFAFVMWDPTTGTAAGACDALSIRKLYYTRRHGMLAFANRAEALAGGDRYSLQYLAERVAACEAVPQLTVYEGVKAIPGGTVMAFQDGKAIPYQYWSPEEVEPLPGHSWDVAESAEALRALLCDAVRSRLDSDGKTWSQLSGGVDSSSVVSVAQWLAHTGATTHALSGTVTYIDRQGTAADERAYSDLVVRRWQVPNESVIDPPVWYDKRYEVPRLDQPRQNFMLYPREYRLADIVRRNGGRVLLTGQGPDEYLRGTMFFFADWIARGHIWRAIREMARRAALGRVSFWELAYRNALTPLLSGPVQRWFRPEVTKLPPWIGRAITRRYELHKRGYELGMCAGRPGHKYRTSLAKGLVAVRRTVGHLVLDDFLDVRHPFLDRRLLEFGLRLPPELIVRPHQGKWLLREAMRGLLPDPVRKRVGKGTMRELYAWSLIAQRKLLEPLTESPILADLGIVDGARLRRAFLEMPHEPQRRGDPHARLQQVLAIEAWLQIRAGRWPREAPIHRSDGLLLHGLARA